MQVKEVQTKIYEINIQYNNNNNNNNKDKLYGNNNIFYDNER